MPIITLKLVQGWVQQMDTTQCSTTYKSWFVAETTTKRQQSVQTTFLEVIKHLLDKFIYIQHMKEHLV